MNTKIDGQNAYTIFTSQKVKYIIKQEGQNVETIYPIDSSANNQSKGVFSFKADHPSTTNIAMYGDVACDTVFCMIVDHHKGVPTKNFPVPISEPISLQNTINTYLAEEKCRGEMNFFEWISQLITDPTKMIYGGKGGPMGGERDSLARKLTFTLENYAAFFSVDSMEVDLFIDTQYMIKSVYILAKSNNDWIFCAGDDPFCRASQPKECPTKPKIEDLFLKVPSKDTNRILFRLRPHQLKKCLSQDFQLEEEYEFGVIIEKDGVEENPKAFSFRLLSDQEKQWFKQFIR